MVQQHASGRSVLIPAGFSPKSLTSVRSLGSHGVHTVVASHRRSVPAFASRYCDEAVVVPSPWEDLLAYKDALLKLAARPDISVIIPSQEEDAFLLSKYSEEFAEHVAPLWPPMDTLRTAHDGKRLPEVAEEIGLRVPETMLYDEVDDWSRKLIVKARYSILTSEYAPSLSPTVCEGKTDPVHPSPGTAPSQSVIDEAFARNPPIVQEYVPIAQEYSFRALCDHGDPVATSLKRQVRGKTYAGGASVFCELIRDERIEEMGRRLLEHLDWHGIASVQFIEDARTGELKFTEINPRTWTSIPLDVRGGVDYPYFYWLLARGMGERIQPTYEEGFAAHLLFGEFQYLRSVLRDDYPNAVRPTFGTALRDVLTSIYEHPNSYFLIADDPVPFVSGLRNVLSDGN